MSAVHRKQAPQGGDADVHAALGQQGPQLRQRRIGLLFDRIQDEGRMVLDLRRSTVTVLRLGRWRAVSNRQLSPPDRARSADPEPRGGPPARHTAFDGSNDTIPKITR
jgi:hypothetical protein